MIHMIVEDFLEYLKNGESEQIEFKSKVTRDIGEEVCALANSQGGFIFVGVTDSGGLKGCDVKKSKEIISQYLNNITPPLEVGYEQVNIDDKNILVVRIPRSDHLCGIGGTVYIRTGTSKRPLSLQEILTQSSELLLYEIDTTRMEQSPNPDLISRFVSEARVDIKDPMKYMKNMGAMTEDGKLTMAGLLLLHDEPQSFLPHTSVRMIFQDNSWKRFTGPLWKIIEGIEEELKKRFVLSPIQPGFKRVDIYEYPLKAIREGVVNSLVHRNYGIKSEIFIELYADRLVIKNPGSFPPGTTPEHPHPVPRNSTLYELLFQMGYVERQGRGVQLIKDECGKHPYVSFEYVLEPNHTTLIFKKEVGALSTDEEDILSSLSKGEKSAMEITSELDVSKVTVLRKLSRLMELGFVEKVGRGPSTRYKLGVLFR